MQNASLSWYTSHPEFTACFQRTVLVWFECGLFWLISLFYVIYLVKSPADAHATKTTKLFILKMVSLQLFIIIAFCKPIVLISILNCSQRELEQVILSWHCVCVVVMLWTLNQLHWWTASVLYNCFTSSNKTEQFEIIRIRNHSKCFNISLFSIYGANT